MPTVDWRRRFAGLSLGWMWLKMTVAVHGRNDDFAKGLRAASSYWQVTELSRLDAIAARCESNERSYLDATAGYFEA